MIDLQKNRKIAKLVADELGYNVKQYIENEPYLYTQAEMEQEYLKNSGVYPSLWGYDAKQMIEDDITSGYLHRLMVEGKEYLARIY